MSARQINVLLSFTDEEAAAMIAAGETPDDFVRATRKRWAFAKTNAVEFHATLQPEGERRGGKASW